MVGEVMAGAGAVLTYGIAPQPVAIMKAPIILAKSANQVSVISVIYLFSEFTVCCIMEGL